MRHTRRRIVHVVLASVAAVAMLNGCLPDDSSLDPNVEDDEVDESP